MSSKRIAWGFMAAVIALLGGAWVVGAMSNRVDPEVAQLEVARDQMFKAEGGPSEADRQAFRERIERLSEAQRREFFQRSSPAMMDAFRRRMDDFFARSPDEQRREIGSRVDQIIAARREDAASNAGGPGGPEGRGGPGGRFANMSDDQRDAFRKGMLDRTDPKLRGQFTEFRRMVNGQLEARGEEPLRGREMRHLFRERAPRRDAS